MSTIRRSPFMQQAIAFYEAHGHWGPYTIQGGAGNASIDRTDASALIPEDAAKEIIGAITQESAVMRLARRRPNMTRKQQRIPVKSTLPTAYFVAGDTGLKQTTEQSWDNVYLNAEELAVIVPMAQSVLDDSDYDIAEAIKADLVEAMGIAIDAAVLFGTNKPGTWPVSIKTGAANASNTVAAGAGADIYDDILGESGVFSKVEADGYMVNGNIDAVSMMAKLRGLRDSNGNPIFLNDMKDSADYRLAGTPIYFPENGAFDASTVLQFSGDWGQLVYSLRQDITYTVATEAVIQDNAGNILYNLFQNDMVAIRAVMRIAFAVPNPVNRLNSNASTRYPFATYTP